MDQLESLSHSVWECKYHVAFIPKCRRRVPYEGLRPHLGELFRRLAERKESQVLEGHLMPDHVHMLLSIPPKCSSLRYVQKTLEVHSRKRFEVFHRELREGFGKERCSCLTTDGDWIIVNQVID
jgi:REP element-mobilizing transposase RayT